MALPSETLQPLGIEPRLHVCDALGHLIHVFLSEEQSGGQQLTDADTMQRRFRFGFMGEIKGPHHLHQMTVLLQVIRLPTVRAFKVSQRAIWMDAMSRHRGDPFSWIPLLSQKSGPAQARSRHLPSMWLDRLRIPKSVKPKANVAGAKL
jgi:hypothetical protein